MKLEISTKHFKEVVSRMATIPGAHTAVLFTQAVRFTADMQGLTISRFTAESRINILIEEVKIEDEGESFLVDHTSLTRLISRMPGKNITLTRDDKKLYFVSGSSKGHLMLFSEESDAEPPEAELETEHVRLPIEDLTRLFNFASPAMSNDFAGRPNFCGVCIRMMQDRLSFIATDGKRCHISFFDEKLPVDCIVAANGVDAILKAISNEAGACTLAVGENTISIIGSNVELSLALVNEGFPNMEPFLTRPESSILSKVTVNLLKMVNGLKTCSEVGETEAKWVRLEIEDETLTIIANNKRDSELSDSMECRATVPVVIVAPSVQLIQALEQMTADEQGDIELTHYLGSLFVRQADRIAFVALQKVQ